jgi:penicillin-binding protein 1C
VGVEAASRRYFGKPAAHLSLAEAALLAGLPNSPTRLNPFTNPEAALGRRRYVLRRMRDTGAIDEAERARALAEPLVLVPPADRPHAMHFTDWVLAMNPVPGEIRTTLDADLETEVERLTAEHVRSLAGAGVTNSAVVVLDNETCRVRVMVGSVDYWSGPDGAVNGALARRQPGSTLKPFVYALAFAGDDTPASVVPDVETTWGRAGAPGYSPRNYDGTFAGPVLMGDALGRSLNVPAVRTADRVGVDALLAKLHELGFASLDQPAGHYGLGLALGDGEVRLVELAQAYAALAREGVTCRATPFPSEEQPGVRAFSPEVSWLVTDVLSDETLRIAAFGPANSLLLGFPVAVKTGTSSNWRDSWAVGYTDRFTVAVWSGDFAGRPLRRVAGATGAGLLFHRVMRLVVERGGAAATPVRQPPPPGVVEVTVCALSGRRAEPHCPHRRAVHVRADHAPAESCEWHREVAIDRRNHLLAGADCPAQFVERRAVTFLPPEYAEWAAATGRPPPPVAESPLCPLGGGAIGAMTVTSPSPGDVFVIEPGYDPRTQSLPLAARVDPPVDQVTWFVDGRRAAVASWPYRAQWALTPGAHEIVVSAGGRRSEPVVIQVR